MNIKIIFLLSILGFVSCRSNSQDQASKSSNQPVISEITFPDDIQAIEKDNDEWKKNLTEMEYYVLREAGTERPFNGDLLNNKQEGVYTCAGCNLPLFASNAKFKSGTGWPSFYQPIDKKYITEDTDNHLGYPRTEIRCARCDGHQGHVFKDGPKPTGLRYCINSVSLNFVETVSDSTIETKK